MKKPASWQVIGGGEPASWKVIGEGDFEGDFEGDEPIPNMKITVVQIPRDGDGECQLLKVTWLQGGSIERSEQTVHNASITSTRSGENGRKVFTVETCINEKEHELELVCKKYESERCVVM
jgi:hypothetical protein